MKKMMLMAVTALMVAGCSSDENGNGTTNEAPKYITVNANISGLTKAATDHTGAMVFEAGDAISVYAWTGDKNALPTSLQGYVVANAINTYDGSLWTAQPQMLWKNMTDSHYFLAVYPQKDITVSTDFNLDTQDQQASDILVAVNKGSNDAGITATNNAIPLVFDHIMAKLQINLNFRNQWAQTPEADVKVKAMTTGTIDYLNKSVTANGEAQTVGVMAVSTPVDGYEKTCETVMIPQQGFNTIIVTINNNNNINNKDYIYKHTNDFVLERGKMTVVNLIVGRDEIELGSVTINNWNEGNIYGDGEDIEVPGE